MGREQWFLTPKDEISLLGIRSKIERQGVLQRNFRNSEVPFFVWEISAYLPYLHVFLFSIRPSALGIGAASFAREAIAERAKI